MNVTKLDKIEPRQSQMDKIRSKFLKNHKEKLKEEEKKKKDSLEQPSKEQK